MKIKTFLTAISFLALASCSHSPYVLNLKSQDGQKAQFTGTVISVERDRDFVLEVGGKYLFVDMGDLAKKRVELGDYIEVHGKIDVEEDGNERPELDATKIKSAQLYKKSK